LGYYLKRGWLSLSVTRIERIVGGRIIGIAERGADGNYACHLFGSNVDPVPCTSLDDVADFLRTNTGGGVRMNPGWVKISRNIYIDGILLR